jgi:Rha family phage regulatory protein
MKTNNIIPLNTEKTETPLVELLHNQPMTTSLKVAEFFGKDHKNVLRDIQNLGCPDDFNRLNFELVNYVAYY